MPANEKSAHILSKILIPNNNLDWVFYCDINSKASLFVIFRVFLFSKRHPLQNLLVFVNLLLTSRFSFTDIEDLQDSMSIHRAASLQLSTTNKDLDTYFHF